MSKSLDFDDLGDRAKSFEARGTQETLIPGIPILARMDGRAFHTFARSLKKPYDTGMSSSMVYTAGSLLKEFKADLAYTQSDEITLLWKNDDLEKQMLFGGRVHKLVSSLAAYTSVVFYQQILHYLPEKKSEIPTFDARVWQVPNLQIAADALLWREMDANKNAVSMAASTVYSEKELNGKGTKERIEMLYEKGISYGNYPTFFKRGVFLRKAMLPTELTKEEWELIPAQHRPESNIVIRSRVVEIEAPPLARVENILETLHLT